MGYEIGTKELAAQTVTSMRRRVALADLSPFIEQAIAEMRGMLRDAGVPEAGAPFVIFHDKVVEDHDGEVEVCMPCAASDLDEGVVERRELPAARVAFARVPSESARYPEIIGAYDAVADRIVRDGFLLGDAPREIYDGEATEVVWPIGGSAEDTHATVK